MSNLVYYAIGDIHGEAARLVALHKRITDFHNKFHHNQPQTRIHLGDYVDRGSESFTVIKYLREMEKNAPFRVINLKGNHESLMVDAYRSKRQGAMEKWLFNGGKATIASYQRQGYQMPLKSHLDWIEARPNRYLDEQRHLVFVHAGIDPDSFPNDSDNTRLWTRSERFFNTDKWTNPKLEQICVIHGHTTLSKNSPEITSDGRRINIDTGVCYGGNLTAIALTPNEKPRFIYA